MYDLLLIDSDQIGIEMLARRLERKGYRSHTVGSSKEALLKLESKAFTLVIIDTNLPDMNKWELIKEVNTRYPQISSIALTSHAMSNDKEIFLSQGFDEYETKPLNFLRLVNKISSLCQKESLCQPS